MLKKFWTCFLELLLGAEDEPVKGELADQYGLTESDRKALRVLAKEEALECMELIHGSEWRPKPGLIEKSRRLEAKKYKQMAEPGLFS